MKKTTHQKPNKQQQSASTTAPRQGRSIEKVKMTSKVTSEAASSLMELSSSTKRPLNDGKKYQRPEAKRARESEQRVYEMERQGLITKRTCPLLLDGHMRKPKYVKQGEEFEQYLIKEKKLKDKFVNQFDDNKTRGNPLPSHVYESVLFYSEEALEAVYPGKKITGLEVLENGKQTRPISKIVKYGDIPNTFLSDIRTELIKSLSNKRNFIGALNAENKERKRQGENIPEEEEGELRNHLCCLFFISLFHSIKNSFILRFWS